MEVSMAYARSAVAPRTTTVTKLQPAPRSFWRRLLDAIEQSNMQRAEREIARYLKNHGSKFTDEAEREIERRFL
jgi:hypothetical protein